MIGLGNAVGGRHTPNRSPHPTGPAPVEAPETGATDAGAGGVEDTGR